MRRTVNSTFISLDGVQNHMEHWHFDLINDELADLALEQLRAADAMLMGRATYESYAAVWPERVGETYADIINAMPKYVASTTLEKPGWENTSVIEGDLVEAVRGLKEQRRSRHPHARLGRRGVDAAGERPARRDPPVGAPGDRRGRRTGRLAVPGGAAGQALAHWTAGR